MKSELDVARLIKAFLFSILCCALLLLLFIASGSPFDWKKKKLINNYLYVHYDFGKTGQDDKWIKRIFNEEEIIVIPSRVVDYVVSGNQVVVARKSPQHEYGVYEGHCEFWKLDTITHSKAVISEEEAAMFKVGCKLD